MIIHNVIQGSEEWIKARLGVVTASNFDRILSPTGKLSKQADDLENRIVSEILTGQPCDDFKGTYWTDRGNVLEPEAVAYYEFARECKTEVCGFVTNDDGTIGASPDRLIGADGMLEIKCPAANTQVAQLLNKSVDTDHKPQLQGQLYVSGRKWVDILSYHHELPKLIMRVERDDEYITALDGALKFFLDNVKRKLDSIRSNY